MSTADVIALIGLLVVIAGLFAGQWWSLQKQREEDGKAYREMIDASRAYTDLQISEVHHRINECATKDEASAIESRTANRIQNIETKIDRIDGKLDRLIERGLPKQ